MKTPRASTLPNGVTPSMFAKGMRIETREHHLPAPITRKLVTDHLTLNKNEYKGKR
jgi:hypothetical protein